MPGEIPLFKPDITNAEIAAVTAVLRSGELSGGFSVEEFERQVAEHCDCTHAVAVSSGTAALHLALLALGVEPGDEVITSPYGNVATVNAINYTGATPVLVDIDPITMNLDPASLEQAITPQTRAIIATATLGNPSGLDRIAAVAARHEVSLIENGGEAFGARLKDRPTGSFGRVALFSFHPDRPITTGEGGVVVTRDDKVAELARSLRNHGQPIAAQPHSSDKYQRHDRLGYNYRLSELSAALGLAQLDRIDEIIRDRRQVAAAYFDRLIDFPELVLPTIDHDTELSWYTFTVRLDNQFDQEHRDRILTGLRRHEVGASNHFPPIHLQPCYADSGRWAPGDFPVTESIASRSITLPFYTALEQTQIDLIANTLRIMLDRENAAMQANRPPDDDPDTEPPRRG